MLFALYVQFHGDYGPGGGFQAGVIFAAAIILYALIFGLETAQAGLPAAGARVPRRPRRAALRRRSASPRSSLGGNFLDYDVLAHDPVHGQHLGILLVELGVGITVAAVMATIFFLFAGQGARR